MPGSHFGSPASAFCAFLSSRGHRNLLVDIHRCARPSLSIGRSSRYLRIVKECLLAGKHTVFALVRQIRLSLCGLSYERHTHTSDRHIFATQRAVDRLRSTLSGLFALLMNLCDFRREFNAPVPCYAIRLPPGSHDSIDLRSIPNAHISLNEHSTLHHVLRNVGRTTTAGTARSHHSGAPSVALDRLEAFSYSHAGLLQK